MEKKLDIPKRLRQVREGLGMSMDQFAKALGLAGASSYQRYEEPERYKSKAFLPLDMVQKIARMVSASGSKGLITEDELIAFTGFQLKEGSFPKSGKPSLPVGDIQEELLGGLTDQDEKDISFPISNRAFSRVAGALGLSAQYLRDAFKYAGSPIAESRATLDELDRTVGFKWLAFRKAALAPPGPGEEIHPPAGMMPEFKIEKAVNSLREMGARYAQALAAINLSISDAARLLGHPDLIIHNVINGRIWLSENQFRQFATVAQVTPEWLKFGGPGGPETKLDVYQTVLQAGERRDIAAPILSGAAPLDLGSGSVNSSHNDMMVETVSQFEDALTGANKWGPIWRPQILDGVADAYAFEMWHSRLEPAIKQSCIAFVWPGRSVQPGDEIVLVYKNGMRKPFTYKSSGLLRTVVGEHSPQQVFEVDNKDIDRLDLIVLTTRVRM